MPARFKRPTGLPLNWSNARTREAALSGAALLVVLAGACSASVGTGSPGSGASSGVAAGSGVGATGGGAAAGSGSATGSGSVTGSGGAGSPDTPDQVTTPDGTVVDCGTLQRPPTPLRRLTRFEYNSTVRDLLSTTLKPADSFPPDEISDGFSNNAVLLTVSSLHAEKYLEAAEDLAAEAAANLSAHLGCDPVAIGEEACARQFAESFGKRAYRRLLEPADLETLMEAYAFGDSFEKGIEIMIRTALQSPHFLFRIEFTGSDVTGHGMARLNGYETSARLSYLIWSSIPDPTLLAAAEAGDLGTLAGVEAQARRMLSDPKARLAVLEFYRQWLDLTRLDTTTKDTGAFPLWSDAMRAAMKQEADAVVENVVFGTDASLSRLLTAPLGLPTGPLAQLYGITESVTVTELPSAERSGILTLPGFMSVQAHPDQTSPVRRGKFIRNKLLCTDIDPPPDNVDISPPDPTEGGTARERFSAHSEQGTTCTVCHQQMDPLGFPLENYDAMGVFRTTDGGQELDLSGTFVGTADINGDFVGAAAMMSILAGSQQVKDCVASEWYKFAIGRSEEAGDACSLSPLQESFTASGANLLELLVKTTQTEAFLYRRANAEEVSP